MSAPRIAIIDSGVHSEHPHVNGIAGGVGIGTTDYLDRLGHGTCVAAVIREKAPQALLYAVKIFDRKLSATIETLVAAIRWSIENRMNYINLSLGTVNPEHAAYLQPCVEDAHREGISIISAQEHQGTRWLPGSLPHVIPVLLDWSVPREAIVPCSMDDGRTAYRASGFPRPIPGVEPQHNLKGISFAVANVTGCLAAAEQ